MILLYKGPLWELVKYSQPIHKLFRHFCLRPAFGLRLLAPLYSRLFAWLSAYDSHLKLLLSQMSEMSNELIITPLSLVAKEIREQIKRMIPETSTGVSSEEQSEQADRRPIEIRGGILYGGKLLAKKISELVTAMSPTDIDKVGDCLASLVAWFCLQQTGLEMDSGALL